MIRSTIRNGIKISVSGGGFQVAGRGTARRALGDTGGGDANWGIGKGWTLTAGALAVLCTSAGGAFTKQAVVGAAERLAHLDLVAPESEAAKLIEPPERCRPPSTHPHLPTHLERVASKL